MHSSEQKTTYSVYLDSPKLKKRLTTESKTKYLNQNNTFIWPSWRFEVKHQSKNSSRSSILHFWSPDSKNTATTSIANPRSLVISLALSPRLTKTILTYKVSVFPYLNVANVVGNFLVKRLYLVHKIVIMLIAKHHNVNTYFSCCANDNRPHPSQYVLPNCENKWCSD